VLLWEQVEPSGMAYGTKNTGNEELAPKEAEVEESKITNTRI
jgi:hypothetical protein